MNKIIVRSQANALVDESIFLLRHRSSTPNLTEALRQISNRFFQLHNQIRMARSHTVNLYNTGKWKGDRQQRYRHKQRFDSQDANLAGIDDVLAQAYGRFIEAVRKEFARDPYDPSDDRKSMTEKLSELADAIDEYADKLGPSELQQAPVPDLHATVLTGPTLSAYQDHVPAPGPAGGTLQGLLVICAIVVRLCSLMPRNQ